MVTAETISDDQIRELGTSSVEAGKFCIAMWCDYALIADAMRFDIPRGCDRATARAYCAELLNARNKETR